MKRKLLKLLFTMVCLLGSINASAHDIKVENADGVAIYYNYTNNGTELEVTYRGDSYSSSSNEYTGNVVIPETVTILNKTRKVTSIGSSAFRSCSGLISVTIPANVTSIGNDAFRSCSGLTSVTIPSSVTSIGSSAFYYCIGLTSVTIPSSVTSIGSDAFGSCSGLKKVIVKDLAAWCAIPFSESASNPLYHAKHLYSAEDTEITNLVIPEGVASISKYAFNGCSGLTSVTIPSSVTSIGSYAFEGCSGLEKVIVKDLTAWCAISFSGNICNPLYYVKHLYSDEETEITNLVIPEGVTSISKYAFLSCRGLTSVTIPSSVTGIGSYAFSDCSGLTSVTIPSRVTSIGNGAFQGCIGLTSITIPASVTSIGGYAFYNCI